MNSRPPLRAAASWWEHFALSPDAGAAWRSALALIAAWALFAAWGHVDVAVIAAMTAQNIAMLHVRGDYRARVTVLTVLTAVIAVSMFAGTLGGNHVVAATALAGLLAIVAGICRHVSADYGVHFALASALLLFVTMSQPGDLHRALGLMGVAGAGGAIGLFLQGAGWLVRPQHPLRHAAAESWLAAADLLEALRVGDERALRARQEKENAMRAAVDRSLQAIAAPTHPGSGFREHLDELTQLAARLATRSSALHTAIEAGKELPGIAALATSFDETWRALEEANRTAARMVVFHRPPQVLESGLRWRRAADLLSVLDERLRTLESLQPEVQRVRALLGPLKALLPEIEAALTDTVEHAAARMGFIGRLPRWEQMRWRGFGSGWLAPASHLDDVLMHYIARVGVLMMVGVAAYVGFAIPRGYWIPFTVLVVLQPDFGATRERAVQRILGTIAGSAVGSLLLGVRMPLIYHVLCSAAMAFGFTYYLRRWYALAVFFVTLMIVIMTEATMPLDLGFTISRLLATLAGSALALLAAWALWPKWERQRSPGMLAAALRANRIYLDAVTGALIRGEPFAGPTVQAKREAERANSRAAASLQRLLAEPPSKRTNAGRTTTLTAYNQQLTRAITVLGQHLATRAPVCSDAQKFVAGIADALEAIAATVEQGRDGVVGSCLPATKKRGADEPVALVDDQLARIATEVEAMRLAARREGEGHVTPE